ncbi:uncharacterized protein LOC128208997 [Mya arenaria]|uniref:uncharacterized protein LOC128208997 n=1 Tax=Mya arenaria TaxID=6604 RepID=UPI0022DF8252|nr:uncharacterized protein LOC128208997 [Mya arenaria]
MDDCNLEKLGIKPGKIAPAFKQDVLEYSATVQSSVAEVTLDLLTRDSGASYTISGSGGSKKVPVKEGAVTDIKIEVCADDGKTTKTYIIKVKRLSASDATLSNLKVDAGIITPEFSPDVYEYSCLLACNTSKLLVTPTAPDPKNAVTVGGDKPGSPSSLNVGSTNIEIEVTSEDGSKKQKYNLCVTRKQLPRHVKITDPALAMQFEDPISLSTLYQPITIRNSDPKHTFSAPIIDELTKTSKFDPINDMPLESDWRIEDVELDKKMSGATACIPLTYGGASEICPLSEIGAQVAKCNVPPKVEDAKDKFKDVNAPVKHKVEQRKWEKNLQQVFGETSADKLISDAKEELKNYFAALPKPNQNRSWPDGESPTDYLQQATYCYASALKIKPKDPTLHLQLGMLLEENYYIEDMFGLKKESHDDMPSLNLQAAESSKDEECAAICKLHGVEATAPLPLQLKAIDMEYHGLIQAGQSAKADHVMELFQWKSKQATQEGAAAQKAGDEESPLGQAFLKYMDALTCDEAKALFNFHVGRMLVVQGKYDEAVKRLETSLNWNVNHQLSRFYLGLALALKKEGPGARVKEAVTYLLEAFETLMTDRTKQAMSPTPESYIEPILRAENLMQPTNVHLMRGFIQLGRLLQKNTDIKDAMSPQDIFHNAALLATQMLPFISRGDMYKQLEWVILDAHANLLDILASSQAGNEKLIVQRCQRLSALIFHSTIPQNDQLLALQEKTCQQLIQITPCSSHSLYLLGTSQFSRFENTPPGEEANKLLGDVKSSFQASIDLEGKPASGDIPESVKGQQWWQTKVKLEEEKRKAEEAKSAPGKGAPGVKPGAPAGRGGAAGRGAPAGAARGRGTPAPAPTRGGAAARGGAKATPAARGAPAKAPAARGAPAGRGGAAAKPGAKGPAPAEAPKEEPKAEVPKVDASKPVASNLGPAPINRKSYLPRLGLARAHKSANEVQDAKRFYNEVITMSPEVHDSYIEMADMLLKTDPLGAVDVYCKFPVPENPSFDDAYIFGDIVRLLIKAEKYDDPRLTPNMITYGKILGLGVLEKYVKILEEKFKNETLRQVYAGVNGRSVDDQEMQQFFKFKCWI